MASVKGLIASNHPPYSACNGQLGSADGESQIPATQLHPVGMPSIVGDPWYARELQPMKEGESRIPPQARGQEVVDSSGQLELPISGATKLLGESQGWIGQRTQALADVVACLQAMRAESVIAKLRYVLEV
jgi:hypothetical protein